jgi:hypothetical protein
MTSNTIYYVYAYIRLDGTPYYIGKGKGKRAVSKNHSVWVPNKNSGQIIILEKNLTEVGALAIERRLIRWWGKKHEGGLLRNKADGGEGKSGYGVSHRHSEETKRKLSEAKIGKCSPKLLEANRKTAEKLRGRKLSKETKAKLSLIHKGRIMTKEHKANLSKSGVGRPVSKETREKMRLKNSAKSECPHCSLIGGGSAMKRYHFDNCKFKPQLSQTLHDIISRTSC